MKKKLVSSIPRNWLVWEWLLDWNALDSNDWTKNNGTATNVTYVPTDRWYQKQAGSFNGSSGFVQWNLSNQSSFTLNFFYKPTNTASINATEETVFCSSLNNTVGTDDFWFLHRHQSWSFFKTFYVVNTSWTYFPCQLTTTPQAWIIYMITCEFNWTQLKVYCNWVLENTVSFTWTKKTWWLFNFWRLPWNTWFYNWQIQWVRIYNRVLSQQEIQNLYQEWLRQLAQWSDNILSACVWQFENFWDNNLENITSWIIATRVGGAVTTDNFWINKALTNPNYTWASITYTTWYTFENSWSGWWIVTSPAWLSATWINRTTTLRSVFLMNRTLSADEVTQLDLLCKQKYLYPFKKTFPLSLNDWLVWAWLWDNNGTTYYDVSWQWNNGTGTAIANTRVGQHKVMGFNGSSSKINVPDTSVLDIWLQTLTLNVWLKTTITSTYNMCIWKMSSSWFNSWALNFNWDWSNQIQFWVYDWTDKRSRIQTTAFDGKWHMITVTWNWTTFKIYVDWIEAPSYLLQTNTARTMPNTDRPMTIGYHFNNNWNWFNWQIPQVRIWNKALTPSEIRQLYYSTYIQ